MSLKLLFHCSAVYDSKSDVVVLFIGTSGSGKTTSALNTLSSGFSLVVEDRGYIWRQGSEIYFSKENSETGKKVALCFVVKKDYCNRIETMRKSQQALYVIRAGFEMRYKQDKKISKPVLFSSLCDIARLLPVYELHLENNNKFAKEIIRLLEQMSETNKLAAAHTDKDTL